MPKSLTQYRIFIGSPRGLDGERQLFGKILEKYSSIHSEPDGVVFHPVGWEDTLGGVGRPQELINADLIQCDYAVFILHDRWGSFTGTYSSGFEEEWYIAEKLYGEAKLRNIVLFFKKVDPHQLADPGPQLAKVIDFRKRIEASKKHLCERYEELEKFRETLESHLSKWLREHKGEPKSEDSGTLLLENASGGMAGAKFDVPTQPISPGFDFWIKEAVKLIKDKTRIDSTGLYFAEQASKVARNDIEWTEARNLVGIAQSHLNKPDETILTFSEILERLRTAKDAESNAWQARVLFNKGVALRDLGRSEEEIAVYDELIARVGIASELRLREIVAGALINKGVALGKTGRSEEAIKIYDESIARFSTAPEFPLREQFAKALFNKGFRLGGLGRSEEAITVYDDLIARFGTATESSLREQVAKSLVNKGVRLSELGRSGEAITVCDDLIARFGTSTEPSLRERVARALFNKGVQLGMLGRNEEEIKTYDDVVARFGAATEFPLRELVASALVNKGITFNQLGRSEEEIKIYDDVIARFGIATESSLREQLAKALVYKGITLGQLGLHEGAVAVYDDVVARFGTSEVTTLKKIVDSAKQHAAQIKQKKRKRSSKQRPKRTR
jgi:tetratricopeptide (TPR) repeat protein